MKLITLNTWGGRVSKPLLDFFKKNKDVDIFCLQEVYHEAPLDEMEDAWKEDALDLFNDASHTLKDHTGYFRPSFGDWYGLAIFIKKHLTVKEEGDISIHEVPDYKGGGNHPRNLQYITFSDSSKNYTVANVHGLWSGDGKNDSDHRLEQSQRIMKFIDSIDGNKILCGDFNLRPDTKSIKLIEKDMRNLITEYKATSTRTTLYNKSEKFADYVFVSDGIEVKDFNVLPDVVSDHSPLLLEF